MAFKNNSQVLWVNSLEDVNGSTVPNSPDVGISAVNRCINDVWANTDDNRINLSTANGAITSNSNAITTINNNGATKISGVDVAGNSKYYGTNATGTPGFYVLPSGGSTGDMLKATYDTTNNGKVDGAEFADIIVGLTGSGNSKYYGTNVSGNVGIYDLPSGVGDMTKAIYDTNNNGVVDKATEVDGVQASANSTYYGKNASGIVGHFALPAGGGGGSGLLPHKTSLLSKIGKEVSDTVFIIPPGVTKIFVILQAGGGGGGQSGSAGTTAGGDSRFVGNSFPDVGNGIRSSGGASLGGSAGEGLLFGSPTNLLSQVKLTGISGISQSLNSFSGRKLLGGNSRFYSDAPTAVLNTLAHETLQGIGSGGSSEPSTSTTYIGGSGGGFFSAEINVIPGASYLYRVGKGGLGQNGSIVDGGGTGMIEVWDVT